MPYRLYCQVDNRPPFLRDSQLICLHWPPPVALVDNHRRHLHHSRQANLQWNRVLSLRSSHQANRQQYRHELQFVDHLTSHLVIRLLNPLISRCLIQAVSPAVNLPAHRHFNHQENRYPCQLPSHLQIRRRSQAARLHCNQRQVNLVDVPQLVQLLNHLVIRRLIQAHNLRVNRLASPLLVLPASRQRHQRVVHLDRRRVNHRISLRCSRLTSPLVSHRTSLLITRVDNPVVDHQYSRRRRRLPSLPNNLPLNHRDDRQVYQVVYPPVTRLLSHRANQAFGQVVSRLENHLRDPAVNLRGIHHLCLPLTHPVSRRVSPLVNRLVSQHVPQVVNLHPNPPRSLLINPLVSHPICLLASLPQFQVDVRQVSQVRFRAMSRHLNQQPAPPVNQVGNQQISHLFNLQVSPPWIRLVSLPFSPVSNHLATRQVSLQVNQRSNHLVSQLCNLQVTQLPSLLAGQLGSLLANRA